MARFKKISGGYSEVVSKSGLPGELVKRDPPQKRKTQIEVDLPRGSFVDVNGKTFKTLRETWEDESVNTSYAQGDMDARVFSAIYGRYITKQHITKQLEQADYQPEALSERVEDLSFAYYDDDGTPCGFSIVYNNYNETNPSLRSVAIIRNTLAEPETDRKVTLYCAPDLIEHQDDKEFTEAQVSADLLNALNSSRIKQLMQSVISDSGQINLKKLKTLKNRIKSNHNLDDRDVRKPQLDALIHYGEKYLPSNSNFNQYVMQIRQEESNDIDFFESESFKSKLIGIRDKIAFEVNLLPNHLMSNQHKENLLQVMDYTLQAVDLELQGYNSSDYDQLQRCKADAGLLWSKRDVIYNILKFREALDILKSDGKYPELHLKGVDVLKEIESIIKLATYPMPEQDLLELEQVLTCCIKMIDEPKNTENIGNLKKLSQTVSGKQSLLWQALGIALIVFVTVAIIVAGLLGALPTGGGSLVLGAAGASTLLAAGVCSIKHGAEQGLAASVSGFFKASTARNKDDAINDLPAPPAK